MRERADQGPSEAGVDLVRAVARTIGCPVTGTMAARVVAVADARPAEAQRDLLALAVGLRGFKTASGAVAALESLAAGVTNTAGEEPADPRARLEVVRRLIATLSLVDPDGGRLEELHAEEASLSAVAGQA